MTRIDRNYNCKFGNLYYKRPAYIDCKIYRKQNSMESAG